MSNIPLVLSVDDFGDWATPKKLPAGLFSFLHLANPIQHLDSSIDNHSFKFNRDPK